MLGENIKWAYILDFDLVLSIETLDKVSGTWKNVFGARRKAGRKSLSARRRQKMGIYFRF